MNSNTFFGKSVLIFMLASLLVSAGCSKHMSPNAAHAGKETAKTLTDSLTGVWHLDKADIPGMADKMSAFGSQSEKDDMAGKLTQYQTALKGMTVTFNSDSTYQTSYSGQGDVGTWSVDKYRMINTVSKINNNPSSYQVESISGTSLTVEFKMTDLTLLMTFMKK
jgi:hypothetical protein